jgi:molybdopterin-guanine dinucleotide biosynthesis protein A
MGGVDKALLMLGGETLIARAVSRARPQVSELIINANGDPARFAEFGLPVIPDRIGNSEGPLAGVLAGLDWARTNCPNAKWLASFSCDSPFFPSNIVEKLYSAAEREGAEVAIAASGTRHHPVFALWSTSISATSESELTHQGSRKMDDFVSRFRNVRVPFVSGPVDPFFNINTPDDLARAETLIVRPSP